MHPGITFHTFMKRNPYKSLLFVCICTISLMGSLSAHAGSLTLANGSQLSINAQTRHATIIKDGVVTQLWDGVHRLENGSIITVQSGLVIPNTPFIEHKEYTHRSDVLLSDSTSHGTDYSTACEALVKRVCGAEQQCSDKPACPPAMQLLSMQQQGQKISTGDTHPSDHMCIQAQQDLTFFTTCNPIEKQNQTLTLTPLPVCQHVVDRTCGQQNQCNDQPGCKAARQLFDMAKQETDTLTLSWSSRNSCNDALNDHEYFHTCK